MPRDWEEFLKKAHIEGTCLTTSYTHIHVSGSLDDELKETILGKGYAVSVNHCHDQKRTFVTYTPEAAKLL